jgi:hypothetical protein
MKEKVYPHLSKKECWNLLGLSESFHNDIASRLLKSFSGGTKFKFSSNNLMSIKKVLFEDKAIDTIKKNLVINELDYFLHDLEQRTSVYSLHPLERDLMELFTEYFGRKKMMGKAEMNRLIFPGRGENTFVKKFHTYINKVLRHRVTEVGIHDLIHCIDNSLSIPSALKVLAISRIENYAVKYGIIPDKNLNHEYNIYRILADSLTKDLLDLLPRNQYYFTKEAEDVGKAYRKIVDLMNDQNLKTYCKLALDGYSSRQSKLLTFLSTPYKNLYGHLWGSKSFKREQAKRIKFETFNLDGLTGQFVEDGTMHHINYDKSKCDDEFLIWVDRFTNRVKINNPPPQKYFGASIDFSNIPEAMEDMQTLFKAKKAIRQGKHPPHWEDPLYKYFNPQAIRKFYWYRQMTSGMTLDQAIAWLSSRDPNELPPGNFMPQYNK